MKTESKSGILSEQKAKLHARSLEYKSALSSDLDELKVDITKWGKNFLVIGGTLYLVYKVFKLFRGSTPPEPEGQPQHQPQHHAMVVNKKSSVVVSKIKEQIALFLLGIAVQKLRKFIKEHEE